ncbi:MAG TPA: hypothetical protein VFR58_07955 [Flavisolibacter sp.]|nr:hypothetical protein [Flavisolibacter sp.]
MNYLLKTTGHFLCIALSIVLMPLFLAVQLYIWSFAASRQLSFAWARLSRFRSKKLPFRLPRMIQLALGR